MMQQLLKKEVPIFFAYLGIALVAQFGSFLVWMWDWTEDQGDINLYGVYQLFERPRLLPWLALFLGFSGLRLLVLFFTSRAGRAAL